MRFSPFISLLYRLAYLAHHRFFLRPGRAPAFSDLVVVGSCLAGGAGKTPLCEWLAREITLRGKSVALLCHGAAWDEVLLLKEHLPQVDAFSTTNRARLAHRLDGRYDVILCDDGFEDSRLAGAKIICMDWGAPAETFMDLVPAGRCRSLLKDHPDVNLYLTCGSAFKDPDVCFSLSTVRNAFGASPETPVTLMCGLGDPSRFALDVKNFGISVVREIFFRDHSRKFAKEAARIIATGSPVVMSEKDAVRLPQDLQWNALVFVAHENVILSDAALRKLNIILGTPSVRGPHGTL